MCIDALLTKWQVFSIICENILLTGTRYKPRSMLYIEHCCILCTFVFIHVLAVEDLNCSHVDYIKVHVLKQINIHLY